MKSPSSIRYAAKLAREELATRQREARLFAGTWVVETPPAMRNAGQERWRSGRSMSGTDRHGKDGAAWQGAWWGKDS